MRSERNGTDGPGVGAESAKCGVRPLNSPRPGAASRKGVRPDPSSSSAGIGGFQALASPQLVKGMWN